MARAIRAVYQNGQFRPLQPVELVDGQEVILHVALNPADEQSALQAALGDAVQWSQPNAADLSKVDTDVVTLRASLPPLPPISDAIIEGRG